MEISSKPYKPFEKVLLDIVGPGPLSTIRLPEISTSQRLKIKKISTTTYHPQYDTIFVLESTNNEATPHR